MNQRLQLGIRRYSTIENLIRARRNQNLPNSFHFEERAKERNISYLDTDGLRNYGIPYATEIDWTGNEPVTKVSLEYRSPKGDLIRGVFKILDEGLVGITCFKISG